MEVGQTKQLARAVGELRGNAAGLWIFSNKFCTYLGELFDGWAKGKFQGFFVALFSAFIEFSGLPFSPAEEKGLSSASAMALAMS